MNRSKLNEEGDLSVRIQQPKSYEMGVQVPYCVHTEVPEKGPVREDSSSPWRGFSDADVRRILEVFSETNELPASSDGVKRSIYQSLFGSKADLFRAVRKANVKRVLALLEQGVDANTADADGHTLIHMAIRRGKSSRRSAVVEALLAHGADLKQRNAFTQWLPLHRAAMCDCVQIAELLLDQGTRLSARDIEGATPLHMAARHGSQDVAGLLISRGANVDAVDLAGWTPLHYAAFSGHLEVVELLISNNANVNAGVAANPVPIGVLGEAVLTFHRWPTRDNEPAEGNTALALAKWAHHEDIAKRLASCGGVAEACPADGQRLAGLSSKLAKDIPNFCQVFKRFLDTVARL